MMGSPRFALALILASTCSRTSEPSSPVAAIRISPDSLQLEVGTSGQFTAIALDASGAQVTGVAVAFTSTDSAVAATTRSGQVTGRGPGRTTVRASAGSVSAAVPVSVRAAPHLERTSILVPARPFGAAVSSAGDIYVTQQDADALTRLKLSPLAVAGTVPVGRDPGDVAFIASGATAYVTNFLGGTLGRVDVAAGVQTATVALGGDAYRLYITRDAARLFVTCGNGTLQVRQAGPMTLTATVAVGPTPNGMASLGDTLVYVSSVDGGRITEVDVRTGTVRRTFAIGGVPQDLALSKDGGRLFVADEQRGLVIVSVSTGAVLATIPTGGHTFGLGLGPDGWLYVTVTDLGRVLVVDPVGQVIRATIPVGGTPRRVAFDAQGTAVIVPNEGGWVDIIR